MTELLEPTERIVKLACSKPPSEARKMLALICESGMVLKKPVEQSEGDKYFAKRSKSIDRTKSAIDRTLDYARHETLRNIEKHFRSASGIASAANSEDAEQPSTLAERLTFNRPDFTDELLAALREEGFGTLTIAGQQLFDELGIDDPFKMPGKAATGFLKTRENLLSNTPDEIHSEIMQSMQDGLEQGDSRKELMSRIRSKFEEIGQGRAKTIANTETAAAFNFARDKAMRDAGVTHKRWLHSQSPLIKEPRDTHVEDDGQVRPIDKPFDIGGVKFMYPSDDSLGAEPEDIINCHCVALPVEKP